jgi:NDP-sugar pyrophosphorylase family protein
MATLIEQPASVEPQTQPAPRASGEPPRPRRAVILAGGKGLRANPYSQMRNKCLFVVHDQSLVERQIAIIREQLGISDIIVLVGHLKDQVKAALGSGKVLGVSLRYVDVPRVEDGPAKGLMAARELLQDGPFFLFLGDEFHHSSKHERMIEALDRRPDALFTYTRTINPNQILANYSIELEDDGGVRRIVEKPKRLINDLCGCGTLYLTPKIFDAIERAQPSPRSGRVELYETAAALGRVYAVDLDDPDYININTLDDLRRAIFTYRSHRFHRYSISVVIPAWNEAHSIGHVVRDFIGRPQVGEVLVMDNESTDGSAEIARRAGARVMTGPLAGYGDAIHKGLNAAGGDILVVVEADYTFRAADLPKLLEYLKDSACVVGTRTTRQLIVQAASMPVHTRLGNIVMAKYMEVLWFWLETRFTDVGCTYRAIWRRDWREIEPQMRMRGPSFSVEMFIELMKARKICIEVPLSYHPRFGGESKHGKNLWGLLKTAWQMWKVITGRWCNTVYNIVRNWLGNRD